MGELKYSEKTTVLISMLILGAFTIFVVWMLWNKQVKLNEDTVIVCEDFCVRNGLKIHDWTANYYGDNIGRCYCKELCEEYREQNYTHCPTETKNFKLVWG